MQACTYFISDISQKTHGKLCFFVSHYITKMNKIWCKTTSIHVAVKAACHKVSCWGGGCPEVQPVVHFPTVCHLGSGQNPPLTLFKLSVFSAGQGSRWICKLIRYSLWHMASASGPVLTHFPADQTALGPVTSVDLIWAEIDTMTISFFY